MTPRLIHPQLANSLALSFIESAGQAPTLPITKRFGELAGVWADYARHISKLIDHRIEPDGSDEAAEGLRSDLNIVQTWGIAEPAGIYRVKFCDTLIGVQPDFETRVPEAKEIRLTFLEAPGGDASAADRMINLLKERGVPVFGYVSGFTASAHADLFCLGCTRRVMHPDARLMIHTCRLVAYGTAGVLMRAARDARRLDKARASDYVRRTTRLQPEVAGWFDGRDHWFTAEQAKAAGLCDEISREV